MWNLRDAGDCRAAALDALEEGAAVAYLARGVQRPRLRLCAERKAEQQQEHEGDHCGLQKSEKQERERERGKRERKGEREEENE